MNCKKSLISDIVYGRTKKIFQTIHHLSCFVVHLVSSFVQTDEFLLQVIDDLKVSEEGSSGLKGGMELRVRVGDLVGVIQKKHPMGDNNRWFCDTGQTQVSSGDSLF